MLRRWPLVVVGFTSLHACRPAPDDLEEPEPPVVASQDTGTSDPDASERAAGSAAPPTEDEACDRVVALMQAELAGAAGPNAAADARRLHLMCKISFHTERSMIGAAEMDAMIACMAEASSMAAVQPCIATAHAKVGNVAPSPEHVVCADFTAKTLAVEESLPSGTRLIVPKLDQPTPLEDLLYATADALAMDMNEADLMAVFGDCVLLLGLERQARSPESFAALSRCLADTPSYSELWMCRGVR